MQSNDTYSGVNLKGFPIPSGEVAKPVVEDLHTRLSLLGEEKKVVTARYYNDIERIDTQISQVVEGLRVLIALYPHPENTSKETTNIVNVTNDEVGIEDESITNNDNKEGDKGEDVADSTIPKEQIGAIKVDGKQRRQRGSIRGILIKTIRSADTLLSTDEIYDYITRHNPGTTLTKAVIRTALKDARKAPNDTRVIGQNVYDKDNQKIILNGILDFYTEGDNLKAKYQDKLLNKVIENGYSLTPDMNVPLFDEVER